MQKILKIFKKRTELTDESDESYRRTANRKQDFSFKWCKKKSDFHIYSNSRCDSSSDNCCFYWLLFHQERAEEKKQEELLKAEKAKKQNEKKAKTTETAEQKLERVRSQAEEQGVPQSVIELLDKNAETVDL